MNKHKSKAVLSCVITTRLTKKHSELLKEIAGERRLTVTLLLRELIRDFIETNQAETHLS